MSHATDMDIAMDAIERRRAAVHMNHPAPPYATGQPLILPDGRKGVVQGVGSSGIWVGLEDQSRVFLGYGSETLARAAKEAAA